MQLRESIVETLRLSNDMKHSVERTFVLYQPVIDVYIGLEFFLQPAVVRKMGSCHFNDLIELVEVGST